MPKNKINTKLKIAILDKVGTQIMFGLLAGEAENTISRVICGRLKLSPEKQKLWAEVLESDVQTLFGSNGKTASRINRL